MVHVRGHVAQLTSLSDQGTHVISAVLAICTHHVANLSVVRGFVPLCFIDSMEMHQHVSVSQV